MASPNPYAPPDPSYAAAAVVRPIPEGVHRFTLDPVRYPSVVRATLVRWAVPMLALLGCALAGVWLVASALGVSFAPVEGAASFGAGVGLTLVVVVLARGVPKNQIATFELLLGPRVMRRTIAGALPAEVLRPEVSAIYETASGLMVVCAEPARALFVTKGVERFADVRATLADWHPIQPLEGWAAWRVALAAGKQQGERTDVVPIEPGIASELASVRTASSEAWRAFPTVKTAQRTRMRSVVLWAGVIVVFFVVRMLVEPSPASQPSRRVREPSTNHTAK